MLAITGGKLVTITQGILENGVILIDEGKIVQIGENIPVPESAQVIDAKGCWVTPGLIDAHTHIGTGNEPSSSGSTGDFNETSSPITPQVRVMDSFNARNMGVAATRQAGFTTCCTLPGSANLIGGTGFVFKTREGQVVEQLQVPGHDVMKFALGENPRRAFGQKDKMPKTRMGSAALLRETLFHAQEYAQAKAAAHGDPAKMPRPDFRLEPLVPVVEGKMKCRIHCHRVDDIATAIRIAREFHLDYALEHVTEGYLIPELLKEEDVFCTIGPMMTGPYKEEVWNRSLTTPGKLARAGVKVCMTADNGVLTKYLPVHIGQCMAAGMPEADAFRSVTILPAQLLGMADRIGSLEVGKDADIAIFDGHPFCNFTHCTHTIIDGVVYGPHAMA